MWSWLQKFRAAPELPEGLWLATLQRYPFLAARNATDIALMRRLTGEFLRSKEFHGAHGFTITDEVALAVAAQAVLPVLHLDGQLKWYDDFVGIVIHPAEAVAHRKSVDEAGVVHEYDEVLAGEAMDRGPVMLSWPDVLAGSLTGARGYNVVIHEFAHKIDMRNGAADGCPPLPRRFARDANVRDAAAHWRSVMTGAYERFREQTVLAERFGEPAPWLDAYAAHSPGEFFAVGCEAYFVNRGRFSAEWPELSELFDRFFGPAPTEPLLSQ